MANSIIVTAAIKSYSMAKTTTAALFV